VKRRLRHLHGKRCVGRSDFRPTRCHDRGNSSKCFALVPDRLAGRTKFPPTDTMRVIAKSSRLRNKSAAAHALAIPSSAGSQRYYRRSARWTRSLFHSGALYCERESMETPMKKPKCLSKRLVQVASSGYPALIHRFCTVKRKQYADVGVETENHPMCQRTCTVQRGTKHKLGPHFGCQAPGSVTGLWSGALRCVSVPPLATMPS
jgi:hypothetical protein